jgi:hypothetical protein
MKRFRPFYEAISPGQVACHRTIELVRRGDIPTPVDGFICAAAKLRNGI